MDLEAQKLKKMANEYFGGSRITHSSSNCKLSYVESINGIYSTCNGTEAENVEKVKRFLRDGRIVVNINTTDVRIKDFFERNFEIYSCAKLPVGYSNGFQYHILIRNKDSNATNKMYLRPLPKAEKEPAMDRLEKILTKTLKAKRRKTDIVKDVMANLKGQ